MSIQEYETGWPFRAKEDAIPPTGQANALLLFKGEEGLIWREARGMAQVTIDRSNPVRVGWVPAVKLDRGTKPGGSQYEIITYLASSARVSVSGLNIGESILSATLKGLFS